MKVTVTANGPLKKYLAGTHTVELEKGSDLRDLLANLAVPGDSVSLLVLNGQKATIGQELHDGDLVTIYPPVCGG